LAKFAKKAAVNQISALVSLAHKDKSAILVNVSKILALQPLADRGRAASMAAASTTPAHLLTALLGKSAAYLKAIATDRTQILNRFPILLMSSHRQIAMFPDYTVTVAHLAKTSTTIPIIAPAPERASALARPHKTTSACSSSLYASSSHSLSNTAPINTPHNNILCPPTCLLKIANNTRNVKPQM
jgi:hypothetical protein